MVIREDMVGTVAVRRAMEGLMVAMRVGMGRSKGMEGRAFMENSRAMVGMEAEVEAVMPARAIMEDDRNMVAMEVGMRYGVSMGDERNTVAMKVVMDDNKSTVVSKVGMDDDRNMVVTEVVRRVMAARASMEDSKIMVAMEAVMAARAIMEDDRDMVAMKVVMEDDRDMVAMKVVMKDTVVNTGSANTGSTSASLLSVN